MPSDHLRGVERNEPKSQALAGSRCRGMPRDAKLSRLHQHAWADQVYILPESASGARRPYEAPVAASPGRRKARRFLGARKWVLLPPHGWAAACGEKKQ